MPRPNNRILRVDAHGQPDVPPPGPLQRYAPVERRWDRGKPPRPLRQWSQRIPVHAGLDGFTVQVIDVFDFEASQEAKVLDLGGRAMSMQQAEALWRALTELVTGEDPDPTPVATADEVLDRQLRVAADTRVLMSAPTAEAASDE